VRRLPRFVLHLLWWLTLPLFVLTIPLGREAKRRALKMPEAPGERHGTQGGSLDDLPDDPLRMLMIGESPVAGVGVSEFRESIAVQVAEHLSTLSGVPVSWAAIGRNGIRLGELVETLGEQALPVSNWVIWLGGVNDTTSLTSLASWRRQLFELGRLVTESGQGRPVFCPVPPLHQFVGIPQPLRFQLGLRASMLDLELARVCRQNGWQRLELEIPSAASLLAADGYHPSASGADRLGLMIAGAVLQSGASPGQATPEG
jgi:lysophospholipase L1-like esterase